VLGVELDVQKWAESQFGDCRLGDKRRTRRAVRVAAQMAADPDASTPLQTTSWADLKAAYRLFDSEQTSFEALGEPHWQRTRACGPGTWLVLGDTTEIDFGRFRQAAGLGPVGKGTGRGFLLHSGLVVNPSGGEVIGLAGQIIRHRRPAPGGEHSYQKRKRDRESLVWGQLVEAIGAPPVGARFVHVFDRGGDNFEVFCRLRFVGCDWVIRAAHLSRRVAAGGTLAELVRHLPCVGTYQLTLDSRRTGGVRMADLEVRYAAATLPVPRSQSDWLKACGVKSIAVTVIEVRQRLALPGSAPLHWVLLTSLPVNSFEDARRVIGYYEQRPLIEEFHKALKTGCRLESRQYQTSRRLESLCAMLSIIAVRLLQLRTAARYEPERRAEEVVPRRWLSVLKSLRRGRVIRTTGEFYRELAGLGGFLGRKHDGEPGWITLWRGFEKLHLAVYAIQQLQPRCG
jgi:Transposase DNA-binding/Transposase Tn5 dimerisation domain